MPNTMWTNRAGQEAGPYQDRLEFQAELVADIKAGLKTKLWRGTPQDGIAKLQAVCDALCTRLGCGPAQVVGGAAIDCYTIDHKIMLKKVSLVSFLHEFGHHFIACSGTEQNEEFPRAFSLGLFKAAAPILFEKARVNGKLLFVDVEYGQLARSDQVPMLPAQDPNQVQQEDKPEEEVSSEEFTQRLSEVVARLEGNQSDE